MSDKDPAKEVAKILCAVQEKEVLDYDKDPVHNREQRHHYEVEENHEDLVDLEETRILNYNGDLQVIEHGSDYDGVAEDGLEEGEIEDDDIYDTDSDNNYSDDDDLEYDELKNQGETGNESHGVEISDDPSEGEADEVVLINDVRPDEVDIQDLLDIERNEINQNDNQALPPLPASLPTVSSNSTPGRPLPAIPRSRTTPNFPPGKYHVAHSFYISSSSKNSSNILLFQFLENLSESKSFLHRRKEADFPNFHRT